MELSGHGGNNMTTAALDKRNRERLRRHAVEKPEERPSFAEPRKITVERQDSLSNKIQDVLGNMDNVHYAMGKDHNIWLGTSRHASNNNQSSSRSQTGDRSRMQKGGSFANNYKSHASANSSVNPTKSYSSNSKSQNSKSSVANSHLIPGKVASSPHSNPSTGAFNSNSNSNLQMKSPSNKPATAHRGQVSSRDDTSSSTNNRSRRLHSVDIPAAMDNIFREMRMQEPISEIQTPQIVDKDFSFAKNETRAKTSLDSEHREDADARNSEAPFSSESDSSEDDDSESDDNDEADGNWNLMEMMSEIQKSPSNPILNPDPPPPPNKVKTCESFDKKVADPPIRSTPDQISMNKKTSSSGQSNNHKAYNESNETRNTSVAAKDERRIDKRIANKTINQSHPQASPRANQSRKPKSNQPAWSRDQRRVPSKTAQDPDQDTKSMSSMARVSGSSRASGATELPFSVSNHTVSAEPSNVRQRTGKKGPASMLSTQQSSPSHETDIPTYSRADTLPVDRSSSLASSSDDESSSSSSSSSSSDSEAEIVPANHSNVQPAINPTKTKQRSNHQSRFTQPNKQGASHGTKVSLVSDENNASRSLYQNEDVRFPNASSNEQSRRKRSRASNVQIVKSRKPQTMQPPTASEGSERKKRKLSATPSPARQPEKSSRSHKKFHSLWVKLPDNVRPQQPAAGVSLSKPDPVRNPSKPSSHRTPSERLVQNSRCDSTGFSVSVDHPPDEHGRSDEIQVAVAGSSSGNSPNPSRSSRRKYPHAQSPKTQSSSFKSKSRKSENSSQYQPNSAGNSTVLPVQASKQHKKEAEQWKERKTDYSNKHYGPSGDQSSQGNQNSYHRTKHTKSAATDSYSNNISGVSDNLAEPDSSWPEQETRFKTSDQFMREGKRLKHEGDQITDLKTGRTRTGESLSRSLLYFEASLCFLMNGYMLEIENSAERNDSSRASHSPTSMYNQTISLLDYIRKMRPHDEYEEVAFKRLNISCLRSQALLFLRIYKLKKEIASKYHDAVSEHFKPSKLNHVPSPVSPAVPSPYGTALSGPSPMGLTNNTCEQVSSSTQVKMTSPPTQNSVMLAPKTYEMFKQYHTIMANLMQAHEKWDQAESLITEHSDFFRHVDVLRGRSLNLDNSLKDLATYNKVILRQLRGAYESPKD